MNRKVFFGHEKLRVYQMSLEYFAFANSICAKLKGTNRFTRDQLIRASQSIPLNIAEGNGKTSDPDRKRFFEIARSSSLECAAIQDVLEISKAISINQNKTGKEILNQIVAMLIALSKTRYSVQENDSSCEVDNNGLTEI